MLEFNSLDKRNTWEFQPNFYIHGNIRTRYDSALVVINPAYLNKVSQYYKEGIGLAIYFYDIPEGEHDVLFNGTHCKLFTWKNINIASKGSIVWKSETNKTYEFDIELSQKGLIVSLTDINGLRDAVDKLIHKPIII